MSFFVIFGSISLLSVPYVLIRNFVVEFFVLIDDKCYMRNFFSFTICGETFGLPLSSIETVVRSAQLLRLPKSSTELLGLLDLRGVLIPIINIPARLNLPEQSIHVDQRIVIARSEKCTVGFFVDSVESVQISEEVASVASDAIYPDMDHYVIDVIWHNGNKILYCDPDKFLFVDSVDFTVSPLASDEG